jgi:putative Holliday junction resolvase
VPPDATGRIVGIDHGERRIGVAVSDPTGVLASARGVVEVRGPAQSCREVAGICREVGAVRVVVGLPVRMDGSEGESARRAREFGGRLAASTGLPVEYWDERFSTVSAQQALIEGGVRRERRREIVDQVAAQILLQHYLDARAGPAPAGGFVAGDAGP